MLLLDIKNASLPDRVLAPFPCVDLERARCALEVAQRLVFQEDHLVDDVVREYLVVRGQDDGACLGEVLFELDGDF